MEHLQGEHEELLGNEFISQIRIDPEPPNFNPPAQIFEDPSRFTEYVKLIIGNILLFLYSIAKIGCCITIYHKQDSICSEPLDVWLIIVIANEGLIIFYLMITFVLNHWLYKKKVCNDFSNNVEFTFGNNFFSMDEISFLSGSFEGGDLITFLNNLDNYNFHLRLNREAEKFLIFLTYVRHLNQFLYLILFLWGCFLMTMKHSNCADVCPFMHSLCMILLLISLLYIFLPLIILISICFCIPCLLISSFFFCPKPVRSIEKDFIKKLERKEFNKHEFTEHDECIICRSTFVKREKIIILPCNKKHYFHASCVQKWLDISCLCPICRADLNQKIKDNMTQKSICETNNLNQIILDLDDEIE